MYFTHWFSHRATALRTKYTVHNFGMDNPNLLNCLTLSRNTLPLSYSLPLFIYFRSFLTYQLFLLSPPSSSYTCIYVSYSIPLSSDSPLFLLTSLFLYSSFPL